MSQGSTQKNQLSSPENIDPQTLLTTNPQADATSLSVQIYDKGVAAIDNFDGDRMAKWKLLSIASAGDCFHFEDLPDGRFSLKYWYVHRVRMESQQTGEYIEPIRVAFISPDGKAVCFVSEVMVRELDQIRGLFGNGPYIPPLEIKIDRIRTKRGNSYLIKPAE